MVDSVKNRKYSFNIILTELCNLHCTHCYMNASDDPTKMRTLSASDLQKIIENLPENTEEIILTGGEVYLQKELLYNAIKLLRKRFSSLNNVKVMIETNGTLFYENDDEIISELSRLSNMGVNSIRLSDDVFHKEGGIDPLKVRHVSDIAKVKKLNIDIKYLILDKVLPIGRGASISAEYKDKMNCMNSIKSRKFPHIFLDINGNAYLCAWKCIPAIGNLITENWKYIEKNLDESILQQSILSGEIRLTNKIHCKSQRNKELFNRINRIILEEGECMACNSLFKSVRINKEILNKNMILIDNNGKVIKNGINLKQRNNREEIIPLKSSLFNDTKLIIRNKDRSINIMIDDVQPLYLFPLTVLDYILPLQKFLKKEVDFLPVIQISISSLSNSDYLSKIKQMKVQNSTRGIDSFCVELVIEDNRTITKDELTKLIINCKNISGLKLSIIIKTTDLDNELIDTISYYSDCIRVNLESLSEQPKFMEYLRLISSLAKKKSPNTPLIAKSYLAIEDRKYYSGIYDKLKSSGADIFLLSKRLLPQGLINTSVELDFQSELRELVNRYGSDKNMRFICVKNISTLYYDRFELDERNSRKCYSSIMKPIVLGNIVFPCKVDKIINNSEKWSFCTIDKFRNKCMDSRYKQIINKTGIECSDCACIFENDFLKRVEDIILDNNSDLDFCLLISK